MYKLRFGIWENMVQIICRLFLKLLVGGNTPVHQRGNGGEKRGCTQRVQASKDEAGRVGGMSRGSH